MAEVEFDQGLIDQAMGQLDNTIDSAADNPRFAGDANLFVRFFNHPHPHKQKTLEEGRPIFEDRAYIEIIVPGDRGNSVNRPVRDQDKRRFPRLWQQFQQGANQTQIGTPLEAWPGITRAHVEELKYFKIFTVEQLAQVPDNIAQRFMGINVLQQKARDFIEASKGMAMTDEMRNELSKKDAQINALTQAIQDLTEVVGELKNSKSASSKQKADDTVGAAQAALAGAVPEPEFIEEEDPDLDDR
jgi:uncharacterized protein YoxC